MAVNLLINLFNNSCLHTFKYTCKLIDKFNYISVPVLIFKNAKFRLRLFERRKFYKS